MLTFIAMLAALYGIIFVFVMMGSHNPWSGRTIVARPFIVTGVLTVLFLVVTVWSEAWGKYAWPAFFGLVVLLIVAGNIIASVLRKKGDGQK